MTGLTFDNQQLQTLRELLGQASRVVIVSHRNADGDAMGSTLGMMHLLRSMGKDVVAMLPNGCPDTFAWMPAGNQILSGDKQLKECQAAIASADLLLGVDFNRLYRIVMLADDFAAAKCPKVLIDHHENPELEAFDVVFSEPDMSSASELCYWVSQALYGDEAISSTVATCFYTGIRTDTGGMSFSCNQPSLYQAVSNLVAKDIDPTTLNHYIFDNFSTERLRFYAFAISERLRIFEDRHFAYFYLSHDDLQQHHLDTSELEGLVNYALKLSYVEVGVLIREENSRIKISFRSKYEVNVEQIAREYFGGGGHYHAAGADCHDMPLSEVIDKVESIFLSDKQ